MNRTTLSLAALLTLTLAGCTSSAERDADAALAEAVQSPACLASPECREKTAELQGVIGGYYSDGSCRYGVRDSGCLRAGTAQREQVRAATLELEAAVAAARGRR